MSQVQYEFNFSDTLFLLKKHICPNCKVQRLKKTYVTENIVKNNESDSSDFKVGRYYFSGDKYIKKPYLYCEKCDCKFTIDEIKTDGMKK